MDPTVSGHTRHHLSDPLPPLDISPDTALAAVSKPVQPIYSARSDIGPYVNDTRANTGDLNPVAGTIELAVKPPRSTRDRGRCVGRRLQLGRRRGARHRACWPSACLLARHAPRATGQHEEAEQRVGRLPSRFAIICGCRQNPYKPVNLQPACIESSKGSRLTLRLSLEEGFRDDSEDEGNDQRRARS